MTGFGFAEYIDDTYSVSIDLKSYNNRFLDIAVNLPPFLNPLEPKIREYLSGRVSRGRVEVYVRYRELEEDLRVVLDRAAARNYLDILEELSDIAGKHEPVTLGHLIGLEGVLKTEKVRNIEDIWLRILPGLNEAFARYEENRLREGEAARTDILSNLAIIRNTVSLFSEHAAGLEQDIRENIAKRFKEVLGDLVDEPRVLAETAVLLVKFSINEEIVRLDGHIGEFERIVHSGEQAGKKLDFLCQELNREFNTVGSKSSVLEINRAVVESKDALEKIREQLRNIE